MKQYLKICFNCGKVTPHKKLSRGFVKCLDCKSTYQLQGYGFERLLVV